MSALDSSAQDEDRVSFRICPLCGAGCGLEVKSRGDRVVSIRGAADDWFSKGYLCPKGVSLKDLHHDPDRLRRPLVKRDGRFVEVEWDEAFAAVEQGLMPVMEKYGGNAVAMAFGNPGAHKIAFLMYMPRALKALGTRNYYSVSSLDQIPKNLQLGLMFGSGMGGPIPDIERMDLLYIVGANPIVSNASFWTVPDFRGKARALRDRGGRIVVIDPRRTETAEAADEHHAVRPGCDVFLLGAMVHTLFAEGLVRLGRAEGLVNGLEEVRQALAPFVPERMAERCGIDAPTIRRLARDLAASPRAAVHGRMGTTAQAFGTLTSWLVDLLNILTGQLDVPGGAMFPKGPAFAANTKGPSGSGRGMKIGRWHSRIRGLPEVTGELPMGILAEEIETPGEGQIRALVSMTTNPVLSAPNGERMAAALEQLDFMVSLDIYLNETTRHADVILPGPSALEEFHCDTTYPQISFRNYARLSRPVMPRAPGQPGDWEILLRLVAIGMGRGVDADIAALDDELLMREVAKDHGDRAPEIFALLAGRRGPERWIDYGLRSGPYGDDFGRKPDGLSFDKVAAAPYGIDLGPLESRLPEVLRTPSGRIELAPALILSDLPRALAELERPVPPLVVIGRRQARSNNSWMHNLPILAKGPFRCTAQVHPHDLAERGIADGATAIMSANGRQIAVTVEATDAMRRGVVSIPHGWGHTLPGVRLSVASARPGANLNSLLDENDFEPLSGMANLNGIPVSLRSADAAISTD